MKLFISVMLIPLWLSWASGMVVQDRGPGAALDLIRKQNYDEAVNMLEEILENDPDNREAAAYMGAAVMYSEQNVNKAREWYEKALKAGGDAVFWVTQSQEGRFSLNLENYSHGWFRIRKGEVEFVQLDGEKQTSMRVPVRDIVEIKQGGSPGLAFHLKVGKQTFRFRPRSGNVQETLLLLVLYRKYAVETVPSASKQALR